MKIVIGKAKGKPFELDVKKHLIDRGLAIFGIRGSGKSYCVGKILEQLVEVGQPFLVIDLEGEYVTLKEHYPVIIISQGKEEYADLKAVKPEMAKAIARVILETGQSAVIDLKEGTMLEKYKFLAEFFPAFYNEAKRLKRTFVLVLDEAHRITPEKSLVRLEELRKYQNTVIYWVHEISATGRKHGIGYIAAAIRSAEVAKTTVTQCELEFHFKTRGIDVDKLKDKASKEALSRLEKLEKGEALVLGLDEEVIVRIAERRCTHGGVTPEFKPIEVPSENFLSKLKAVTKEIEFEEAEPETLRKSLEKQRKQIESLKGEIAKLEAENSSLKVKIEELKSQLSRTPPDVELKLEELKGEIDAYKQKLKELEERNADLERQLSEASRLEEEIERMREGLTGLRDWLMEYSDTFKLDIIPKDVLELKREVDELREKLEMYEKTEKEKELRIKETLEDRGVQNWINSAKRQLFNLKTRKGVFPEVLKQAISYHPDVTFKETDFDVGVTPQTVKGYLRELVDLKLLITDRNGFKNGFNLWITQNVRKIKPTAPDEAIEKIADLLRQYVLD